MHVEHFLFIFDFELLAKSDNKSVSRRNKLNWKFSWYTIFYEFFKEITKLREN